MNKKIFTVLFALILLVSLTACGGNNDKKGSSTDGTSATETVPEQTTEKTEDASSGLPGSKENPTELEEMPD